ncbi:MAG TPA: cyclic nucleotide-binding domain-containing protein [Acidobacteriaceae bacterium]
METVVTQVSSAFVADAELIRELEKCSRPVAAGSDKVLFREGDAPVGVYILRKGMARLTNSSEGELALSIRAGAGSLLGLPAVIATKPYTLTAEALDGAELSLVTCDAFLDLMQTNPSVAFRVLQVLAEEVRFARESVGRI